MATTPPLPPYILAIKIPDTSTADKIKQTVTDNLDMIATHFLNHPQTEIRGVVLHLDDMVPEYQKD